MFLWKENTEEMHLTQYEKTTPSFYSDQPCFLGGILHHKRKHAYATSDRHSFKNTISNAHAIANGNRHSNPHPDRDAISASAIHRVDARR